MKKIFKAIEKGTRDSMKTVIDTAKENKQKIVVEIDGVLVYITPNKAKKLIK